MNARLAEPLTETELDRLGDLLLGRVDEDAAGPDSDEGILDVAELDGLLVAVACAPDMIPPSRWLPVIWGDFPPSEATLPELMDLLMRHYNSVNGAVMAEPPQCGPLVSERMGPEGPVVIVADWCDGFMMGVGLAHDAWEAADEQVREAVGLISLWTGASDYAMFDLPIEEQPDDPVAVICECIAVVSEHRRASFASQAGFAPQGGHAAQGPVLRPPKVGRNQSCPCGSGRKYKHCCLRKAPGGGPWGA